MSATSVIKGFTSIGFIIQIDNVFAKYCPAEILKKT